MALPIIVWENQCGNPDINALSATDTDSGSQYHVDNVADFRPYTRWKAASSGEKFISGDWTTVPGGLIAVDCFAIIGHNLATVAADIYLEVYEGAWVDAGAGKINATADETVIVGILPATKTDDTFRLRLDATTAAAEIGVFLLGEKLEFPRYLQTGFDPHGERVMGESSFSESAELLGATFKAGKVQVSAQFTLISEAWIRGTFKPIWDSHFRQLKPFVFSWNPSGTWANEAVFGNLGDNPTLSTPYDPDRMSLTLPVTGLRRPIVY